MECCVGAPAIGEEAAAEANERIVVILVVLVISAFRLGLIGYPVTFLTLESRRS